MGVLSGEGDVERVSTLQTSVDAVYEGVGHRHHMMDQVVVGSVPVLTLKCEFERISKQPRAISIAKKRRYVFVRLASVLSA